MRKLKLGVCLAFILGFIGFGLHKSQMTAGQTGTLAAPTGVTATDSAYNNKVGISWDTIRSATNYRIFRNTTNNSETAIDIGTTPANSFFDVNAAPGTNFFYWVRAENSVTTSSMSNPDQGSRSGTNNQGPVPPLEPPPVPPGNPATATKTYLGKVLFWDEQLSSTRTVSCGTCHHAANGGTDPRSVPATASSTHPGVDNILGTPDDVRGSLGVPSNNADGTYISVPTYGLNDQVTNRKSISHINAAYAPVLFWDGRATGQFRDPITNNVIINVGGALESQVLGPPLSTEEMAHTGRDWNDVASRVAASKPLALSPSMPTALNTWLSGRSYQDLFLEAFGTAEVTPARIALAIGAYQRTLYSDQTPLDIASSGGTQLTPAEMRGRGVFNSSSCNVCHAGNLLTDNTFRYIGVRPQNDDLGRFVVTGNNNDRGSFRVPSLRNVERRGSFFHNGQFTTLEQVVAFYNRGGDFNAPNKPTNLIRPLGLSVGQQADLVAFLRRPLTDNRVITETGPFDRPALYMGSSRQPVVTGTGRTGSGAFVPEIRAISPPILGNPNFTISVSRAVGNSNAILVIDEVDPGTGTTIPASGSFARVTSTTQATGAGSGWTSVSIPIPNSVALVGRTFFARWYITDAGAANGFSVSPAARFTVFGDAVAVTRAKFVDFDGDGKTDISVFRPAEGNWYILNSSNNAFSVQHFGISTDKVTPADFDGDGKTDIAVFREGTWYHSRSSGGVVVVPFGQPGDIAQPGDYDGDNKADVAIYRPSDGNWWWMSSVDGSQRATRWGISTDAPAAADYDGDGKTDFAVYRGGTWYILKSTGGTTITQFGLAEDKPVVGDYDADGRADIAVWRPSTGVWYHLRSSDGGFRAQAFGLSADIPSPGDYDGDGSNDLAVYRSGVWYLQRTAAGFNAQQFGIATDKPVPSAYIP